MKEAKADCGQLPTSFFSPYDDAFWEGMPIGIEGPLVNQITISGSGELTWNAVPVSVEDLDRYFSVAGQGHSEPFTALDFKAGSSCAVILRVRTMIEKHIRCSERRSCLRGSYKEYVSNITAKLMMESEAWHAPTSDVLVTAPPQVITGGAVGSTSDP